MWNSSKILYILTFKDVRYLGIKKEILWTSKKWNNINFYLFVYYAKKKITVLRAPFIHNKSREQFELTNCFCKIYMKLNFNFNIYLYLITKLKPKYSQCFTRLNIIIKHNMFT